MHKVAMKSVCLLNILAIKNVVFLLITDFFVSLHGVRFSMSGYREQERMTNVPLYGAGVYFTKD